MSVIKLTKSNFEAEVKKYEKPVLIYFYAVWCGSCRRLSTVIKEIADETDDFKVCKVNVDDEPELAKEFEVTRLPTLAVVKDGIVAGKAVGYRSKGAIFSMVEGAIMKK